MAGKGSGNMKNGTGRGGGSAGGAINLTEAKAKEAKATEKALKKAFPRADVVRRGTEIAVMSRDVTYHRAIIEPDVFAGGEQYTVMWNDLNGNGRHVIVDTREEAIRHVKSIFQRYQRQHVREDLGRRLSWTRGARP